MQEGEGALVQRAHSGSAGGPFQAGRGGCHSQKLVHVIEIYHIWKLGGGEGFETCRKKNSNMMSKNPVPPPP